MKNWNFWNYLFLVIGILILVYILSPSARKWFCNVGNKFKKSRAKCYNCDTKKAGIITASGQCTPLDQVAYDKCIGDNAAMKDGADCNGCGTNPSDPMVQGLSGKGVIVSGKCAALPDAFAGKICVPESAPVNAKPLSYKRESIGADSYKYFKTPSNKVSQTESLMDTEISKDDYVQAYLQTITPCPTGQVKV